MSRISLKKSTLVWALLSFICTGTSAQTFYRIDTIAGQRPVSGVPATARLFSYPVGLWVDRSNNLFVGENLGVRVDKVAIASGVSTIFAGTGIAGYSGDGGPAALAQLDSPLHGTVDPSGNVYIADSANCVIRRVDASTGIINTYAGVPGQCGYNGDNITATSAELGFITGVASDGRGNLYLTDGINSRVRRVDAMTKLITTIAGTGTSGFSGDGGPAMNAQVYALEGIVLDSSGNLYFGDGSRIRKVNTSGTISTYAGTGQSRYNGEGLPATSTNIAFVRDLAVDTADNILFVDANNFLVRKITATTGSVNTIAGNGTQGYSGDGGAATSATLDGPIGVAVDNSGAVYVADGLANVIRKIAGGTISTFAGSLGPDNTSPLNAFLNVPYVLATDPSGNLFVGDNSDRLRQINAALSSITTVAGVGYARASADGGSAVSSPLIAVSGVAVDPQGTIYISEQFGSKVRVVKNGILGTVAGNGGFGYSGDGGSATAAELADPGSLALNSAGTILYINDENNARIRAVNLVTGVISTVAGTGTPGYSGDGGPAVSAQIDPNAGGLAVDSAGNLYLADLLNARVRKVSASTGIITTVAGNGNSEYAGDYGPAILAQIAPLSLAIDSAGNLYIADVGAPGAVIRKVSASTGIITTIAGNGTQGYSGDGGIATNAQFSNYASIATDTTGHIYIADSENDVIRRLTPITCSFTLSPASATFSSNGGVSSFQITASDPACSYTAQASAPFITMTSGGIGTGTGIITFSVAPNTDISPAFGTISVGGQTFTISENAIPPTFSFSPSSLAFTGSAARQPQSQTVALSATGPAAFQATAVSNGDWLSVSPASGNAPATLTVTANPAGLAPGTYSGSINISVNNVPAGALQVTLTVTPSLSISTGIAAGTSITLSQTGTSGIFTGTIPLVTNYSGSAFTASASGPGNLAVTPASGTLPALLQVTANASTLNAGNYSGTVTITIPDASPSTLTIPVSFAVTGPQPNQLQETSTGLTLSLAASQPTATRQILVANPGPASVPFQATADQPWITVTPASGTTSTSGAVPLTVTLNLTGFAPGTYNGNITVSAGGQSTTLPIHAAVSGQSSSLLLSETGLTFAAITGGAAPAPQTLQALTTGTGALNYQVSSSTTSGGNWLSVTPGAGRTDTAPGLQVSVNPAGLAPGTYYGLIQVATSGQPAQLATIVFTVSPAGTRLPATVVPTGLVFTATIAAGNPAAQTISINNPNTTAINFVSAAFYANNTNWFIYSPATAQIAAGQTLSLTVQATPQNLARTLPAGVYTGQLTLAFDNGSVQTVDLLLVVAPAGAATSARKQFTRQAASTCSPTKLLPIITSLPSGFMVTAGYPQNIAATIVDDCGNPLNAGTVSASFSNGDAPIGLTSLKNGMWAGTWTSRHPVPQTSVTVTAETVTGAGQTVMGTKTVVGGSLANGQSPIISAGGVVNAASFQGSTTLAGGSLISIFGTNLASSSTAASSLPLPNQLADTMVNVGGAQAPLQYTSTGQVNAAVPFAVTSNSTLTVVVQRGNALSTPEPVTISSAQPAVFSVDGSGGGQGIVVGVQTNGTQAVADAQHPVTAGEAIVLYATGLGAVTPTVTDGAAGPTSPLSYLVDPVTVTVGGVPATVTFAGLAPGFASLYQINAVVPAGAPTGPSVPVVITVDGQFSKPVTIATQ